MQKSLTKFLFVLMIYKYTSILGVLRLAVVVARKREVKLHIVKKKKRKKEKGCFTQFL